MSSHPPSLAPASLEFDTRGTPFSAVFGDVYRPAGPALQQACSVFLEGNGLPGRWAAKPGFTVVETGFGLGHNFLATWLAWRHDAQRCRRLHFVSFEAHPFHRDDLRRYAQACLDGEARALAQQLADAWPVLVPGVHRLEFEDGRVTLTLAFGPAQAMAFQVDAAADAFYLDGFAPRLNPDVWSPRVLGQLVRMARDGATFSTWCSSAQVCRDIEAAGFIVQREPGGPVRRLVVRGQLRAGVGRARLPGRTPRDAIVVGAGIAGASVAWALARQGVQVTVLDPVLGGGPGASHEGHAALAVSPMFQRQDNERARLSRTGVLRAAARWHDASFSGAVRHGGTFMPAFEPGRAEADEAAIDAMGLSPDWLRWVPGQQVAALTGVESSTGGVWFASGMQVHPSALVSLLLAHPGIACAPVQADAPVRLDEGRWRVPAVAGSAGYVADIVVLCNATGVPATLRAGGWADALPRLEGLSAVAGEVYRVSGHGLAGLRSVVAGNGYCVPVGDGSLVLGSTYRRDAPGPCPGMDGRNEVLDKVGRLLAPLPAAAPGLECWRQSGELRGWGGWRASLRDRMPVVGPLDGENTLWVAAAFASRGFGMATLAADVIVARLFGEPLPLERELLARLQPR